MNTPKPEFDSEQSEFQEEWLSAYLDDELSPEQRSIVEQRLATDAAAQNLMADLKRIRQLVQDMPNWSGPGIQVPVDDLPAPGQPAPASELDGQLQGLSDLGGIEESLGAAEVPSLDEDVELSDDIAPLVPTTDRPALPGPKRSPSHWWRPATIAASFLAMAGIGYALWWRVPQTYLTSLSSSDEAAMPASNSAESLGTAPSAPGGLGDVDLLPIPANAAADRDTLERQARLDTSLGLRGRPPEENALDTVQRELRGNEGAGNQSYSFDAAAMPPMEAAGMLAEDLFTESTRSYEKQPSLGEELRELDDRSQSLPVAGELADGVAAKSELRSVVPLGRQQPASQTTLWVAQSSAWSEADTHRALASSMSFLRRPLAVVMDSEPPASMDRFYSFYTRGSSPARTTAGTIEAPIAIAKLEPGQTSADTFAQLVSRHNVLRAFRSTDANSSRGLVGSQDNPGTPSVAADKPSSELSRAAEARQAPSPESAEGSPEEFGLAGGGMAGGSLPGVETSNLPVRPLQRSEAAAKSRPDLTLDPAIQKQMAEAEPATREPSALSGRANSSGKEDTFRGEDFQAPTTPKGLIALFVSRQEAEEILQSSVVGKGTQTGGALVWITSEASEAKPPQPTDKVILLLNPRSN